MIYYVTKQTRVFESEGIEQCNVEKSFEILNPLSIVSFDTETEGLDCHSKRLLSMQLGNSKDQVVIDCTTIDPKLYKSYFESDRLFIGWNLVFDLKFLYKQGIFPDCVWDGILAEKLLYLGWPTGIHSMSLASAAKAYLDIDLDKSVRGKIITQGLNDEVIVYGANDVKYLEAIKFYQEEAISKQQLQSALKLENEFVKLAAYIEFCGVKLDVNKWREKIIKDKTEVDKAKAALDAWVVTWESEKKPTIEYIDTFRGRGANVIDAERKVMKARKGVRRPSEDLNRNGTIYEAWEFGGKRKYTRVDTQGDLFAGFDLTPKCTINWGSSKQVIELFEDLGINIWTVDKKTKEKKKSVQANVIFNQKDKFPIIGLYLDFKGAEILVNTFGEKFLDFINPATGRIHADFHQLGTDTARVTSTNPNLQQLPRDAFTRSCFIAEPGNKWISVDYNGQESFIMASLSNDKLMLDELLNGSGDLHSLTAKLVFPQIPPETPLKDIKKLYHDLRQDAKGYEFAFNYGGNDATLARNYGINPSWAKEVYERYMQGFSGLCAYQENQRKLVKKLGYIVMNKLGYRAHIFDFEDWPYLEQVDPKKYRKRVSDSERQSINYRIQGTGSAMFKLASVKLFKWIRRNNLLGIVKYCIPAHDEMNIECPEELVDEVSKVVVECMRSAGVYFCPNAPLDATPEIGDFWIH